MLIHILCNVLVPLKMFVQKQEHLTGMRLTLMIVRHYCLRNLRPIHELPSVQVFKRSLQQQQQRQQQQQQRGVRVFVSFCVLVFVRAILSLCP